MKKIIYILTAFLLGLVSCNVSELETIKTDKEVEQTGLVAVTMQLKVPVTLNARTRALVGDRSELPSIKDIKVAVFGTSGYPQTYALAEPVDASGNPVDNYAMKNGDTYYFKVLLPVYEGKAHVHIIANGDESIKFVDETEKSIMEKMNTTGNVGAFWTRVVLQDGILPEKDQNGIMRTDTQGNFIPSDETAEHFKNLQLLRNFAEVKLINETTDLTDISWTLVNIPTKGSVAPMAAGTYVDALYMYDYNASNGRMELTVDGETKTYNGYMFPDEPMDYTVPSAGSWPESADPNQPEFSFIDNIVTVATAEDYNKSKASSNFMYERTLPAASGDAAKKTCIMMRARYKNEEKLTYYRIDLMNEDFEDGAFPIYRNVLYTVRIYRVGNHGAATPEDANLRDSGGNVSHTTEAQSLTDISDGYSRLYVEYIEKNFTDGGKKTLKLKYVPNVDNGTADNSKVTVAVKDKGKALKEGSVPTKIDTDLDGWDIYEFELNGQDENEDLVSVLSVTADNGETGDANSKLFRNITLRVMKKMDMTLALVPKKVDNLGDVTVLNITLPKDLPASMFPLIFYIEDINHSLNPTQKDDNSGADIIVPVQTGKSLADGETNSFYFIRTVNYDDYDPAKGGSNVVKTQFQTIKGASATTIYVANEYFKTQSINLLNDGIYINPLSATVHFNVTSVEIDVEFDESVTNKTWTVSGGTDVAIKDNTEAHAAITGGTGNSTFIMEFPVNATTSDVTHTATVTYNGTPHIIEIIQKALEFSITPATQTVSFKAAQAAVTVHADEGAAWHVSVNGGVTIVGADEETGELIGEGTKTIKVNIPQNTDDQRDFTVTAKVDSPEETVTATITQQRAPVGTMTFDVDSFTYNGDNRTGTATSSDQFVTVALQNIGNSDNWGDWRNPRNAGYIQMGYRYMGRGGITVTPAENIRITGITVTYSDADFADFDFGNNTPVTVTPGTYVRTGNNTATGQWTGPATEAITFTNGYQTSYGTYNFPRITRIVVTYEAE